MARKPNIVIINPDEMRADSMSHLGCRAIRTANLDALAAEGASFAGAYCQNPVCTPSRCSFMTGWYPHTAGHRTMGAMLQPHEPMLLKYLKQGGYHVWMNQRNDMLPAQRPGYYKEYCDTYFQTPETDAQWLAALRPQPWRGAPEGDGYYSFFEGRRAPGRDMDDLWVDGACDFIRSYQEERPFCVFLPLQLPHPPYGVPEPWYSAVDRDALPRRIAPEGDAGKCRMTKALRQRLGLTGWTPERFDELRAVYLAMCLRTDALVGRVLDALREKGVYGDTAVFVLSDHGDYAGDYDLVEKQQNSFEDCLIRVPLLVKLPEGMQTRTGVQEGLVELVDFYATVEELAGFVPGHTHFGHSLISYLGGAQDALRDAVFCEGGFRKGEAQCIYSECAQLPDPGALYYPRLSLQMDAGELYNGKAIMCRTRRWKYVKRLYEPDELYDLAADPGEVRNVAADPACAPVLAALRERLLTHYLDTSDAVPQTVDARVDLEMVARLRAAKNR